MAAVRLLLIVAVVLVFFVVATPLQWLLARFRPTGAHAIPRLFCRSLLALAKVRLVVEGCGERRHPVLIVPNHVSWIDIPALGALNSSCFLAKSEIARWPVVSAFAAVQGTVFVDRRRRRSIPGANRAMAERMREGRPVLLFPEGTTIAGPAPGDFRSSHFAAARDLLATAPDEARVMVQPVAVAYSRPDAAWIGDDALLPHLWRVLRRAPLTCRITFCEPIAFVPGSDRKAVALAARDRVVAALARARVEDLAEEPRALAFGARSLRRNA